MTTPQVIQWTHVNDRAPPMEEKIFALTSDGVAHCEKVYMQINFSGDPLFGEKLWRLWNSNLQITHWAIIAPPSTTTAAQTKEQ